MSHRFHKLKVQKIIRETSDSVSLILEVPEALRSLFAFKQGQYLTFKGTHEGEEIRRSYSICSSPLSGILQVAVKKIKGGVFSSYINEQLREGDTLEVMAPQGRFFTEMHQNNEKLYVAIAAGSGITPVLSIIATALQSEPKSRVILLYGNKNKNSIIFKETLEALKNSYMSRLSVYHILSREQSDAELLSGRIDKDKCAYFLRHIIHPKDISEVFLCGPEQMIKDGRAALSEAGVPKEQIHFELFFSAGAVRGVRRQATVEEKTTAVSNITLKLDAVTVQFDLDYQGETILEAALKKGADLPFSCKGGMCATCRAKVEKGRVTMDTNYALEAEEVKAGFILACQSHPRSKEVVINFDIK